MSDFHLTDVGNGKRFVALFGERFRHCHPWKQDLIWTSKYWRADDTAMVERYAKETARRIYCEAPNHPDDEHRKQLAKWAAASEDLKHIRAMIALARSEPGIALLPDEMNANQSLFNCLNGTVNLQTGKLQPHCKDDFITKLAPVKYEPDVVSLLWDKCLKKWMADNNDLIGYLQRVIGYALTGSVKEECIWFFYGDGANGKSTFLGTMLALFGDYGMQAVPEMLLRRSYESHPTERADLFARRFVATIEIDEGKHFAEAILKQITGGDRIRARFMYKDFFEFEPSHKLFLAANHKPIITGMDQAMWRRIKLVPFTVTITQEEMNRNLKDDLKKELPGILNWAIKGCQKWQESGLGEPDEIRQATADYKAEQDKLGEFLVERCFLNPELKTPASLLLDAYQEWSGDKAMTAKMFGKLLNKKGYLSQHERSGWFYYGIGLSPLQT